MRLTYKATGRNVEKHDAVKTMQHDTVLVASACPQSTLVTVIRAGKTETMSAESLGMQWEPSE